MGKFFSSAEQLWAALGGAEAPVLVDVRRRPVFEADGHLIPGARWSDHADPAAIAAGVPAGRDVHEARALRGGRRRPKIDRIACPWLILRFIDPQACFLFVGPDQVLATAGEYGGIAFYIAGAGITHHGPFCSFDTLLARNGIADRLGLPLCDALYAWRRKAPGETHSWPTVAAVPA
ncbi:MAG: chromate resistance protein ChrB domain-containing protein [Alphaproteobacteria bacterium]